MTMRQLTSDEHARLQALILDAFRLSRETGRSDWNRMTAGVLKNRLLLLTDRQFNEGTYGAHNFTEFVGAFPDILSLDESVRPPLVELLDQPRAAQAVAREVPGSRMRLRPDLWRATMDYSSGTVYVWDTELGTARATVGEADASSPQLPTVSPSELEALRKNFVGGLLAQSPTENPQLEERLRTWSERNLGTWYLPSPVRTLWNQALVTYARDRLAKWFDEHNIATPVDLLTEVVTSTPADAELRELRRYIIKVVNEMDLDELRSLSLPVRALFRIGQPRSQ